MIRKAMTLLIALILIAGTAVQGKAEMKKCSFLAPIDTSANILTDVEELRAQLAGTLLIENMINDQQMDIHHVTSSGVGVMTVSDDMIDVYYPMTEGGFLRLTFWPALAGFEHRGMADASPDGVGIKSFPVSDMWSYIARILSR